VPRRMADDDFRRGQKAGMFSAHIRPVNDLVEDLRAQGRGFVPYVAPLHGGVESRMLSILRDPGPATRDGVGSGFLCIENDDPAAEF